MSQENKIYIAGHRGMVGSAIVRAQRVPCSPAHLAAHKHEGAGGHRQKNNFFTFGITKVAVSP